MLDRFNPTMLERSIGRTIAGWRNDRGWSLAESSKRVRFSTAKLSMMENALQPCASADIMALGYVYDVPVSVWQSTVALAEHATQQRSANRHDRQALFDPAVDVAEISAEAVRLRSFAGVVIPAILQTHDYALTRLKADDPLRAAVKAEQQRTVTQAWQKRIRERNPLMVEIVFAEAALRQEVGTPDIMSAQLGMLLELSQYVNITIQVITYDAGAYPAMGTSFTLLSFPHPLHDDVVYCERLRRGEYIEERNNTEPYAETFRTLQQAALSPDKSADFISGLADGFRTRAAEPSAH